MQPPPWVTATKLFDIIHMTREQQQKMSDDNEVILLKTGG